MGSIGCDQSAVAVRLSARLACTKLTLLTRSRATRRTLDGKYVFGSEFLFHTEDFATGPKFVDGQFWTAFMFFNGRLGSLPDFSLGGQSCFRCKAFSFVKGHAARIIQNASIVWQAVYPLPQGRGRRLSDTGDGVADVLRVLKVNVGAKHSIEHLVAWSVCLSRPFRRR
jgi:hypothetical protein